MEFMESFRVLLFFVCYFLFSKDLEIIKTWAFNGFIYFYWGDVDL